MQTNLFGNVHEFPSGLEYFPNFINQKESDKLLEKIDNSSWMSDLKRRVQHYGFKYDYKVRNIDYSMRIGEIPNWLNYISERICANGIMKRLPEQVIINEYLPGQGISTHVDCEPCFGDTIISISLLSPCVMELVHKETRELNKILLEPNSLLILKGESRYDWLHGIKPRKFDTYNNYRFERKRRVSLTFRNVIIK